MPGTDFLAIASAHLQTPRPNYLRRPQTWVEDVIGGYLWSKQIEIIESVRDNRYTTVQACHGVGKSQIAAWLTTWWLSTKPVGEAYVVTTAPTARQVEAVLWRYIREAHTKGNLHGRILGGNQPRWKTAGGVEIGMGRKPAHHDAHGFQGIHERHLLVVVDEACGIPQTLWNAITSLATNDLARVLAIGNPDDPTTHFKTICDPGSKWHRIRVDALQSPNVNSEACRKYPRLAEILAEAGLEPNDEPVPDDLREKLVSAEWIVEAAQDWGVGSSLWQSKVRGEFPTDGDEGIVPLGWVEAAMRRWEEWDAAGRPDAPGRLVVACDVARYGEDKTAVATRQGHVLMSLAQYAKQDTITTADVVSEAMGETPHAMSVIDVVGVGGGVVDYLRRIRPHNENVAFSGGEQDGRTDVTGRMNFNNNRSAAWWGLRELLDPSRRGGAVVALPPDERLKADLVCPRFKVQGTRIVVESKDDIRRRLGRSPDAGDAVVMAFWPVAGPVRSGDDADVTPWGGDEHDDEDDDAVTGWG